MTPHDIIQSVALNYGLTLDLSTGNMITDGFIVATEGYSLNVPKSDFFGASGADIISSYIGRYREELSEHGRHLGVWHNESRETVILDVVEQVWFRDEVIRLGVERNQNAIYDADDGIVIDTKAG